MRFYRILFTAITVVSWLSVSAQVDLTSQRREVQTFQKVPGHKVDHKGIIINPVPHSLSTDTLKQFSIARGFKPDAAMLTDFSGDFTTLDIPISDKGMAIKADYGEKVAARADVKLLKGAYKLGLNKKGIKIVAYDKSGVFYALQTLRQLIDSPIASNGTLPGLEINDWPDLPYRGVVEGFYGTPWSHDVRLSLIDFYGRNKMTDYIYGPKDDPFHSSPNWRKPYPTDQAKNIAELVEACKKNHVNFVWAIHPGKDIRWDKADYDSLVAKFDMMYDLGVRSFALFFDDIRGKGTDSNMQTKLVNDLTRDFVKAKGDVSNLMICPTDYTELWANPAPDGQLAVYGEKLDPGIEIFWTGAIVCSDLTPSTLNFVNSRIKRPALFWWNFPVTDYCPEIILQGPVYGLDTNLSSADVAGLISNPMENGEASKLALYGVADYAWNIADYNPIDNWERGLALLAPEAPEAYRRFAIHSADTQSGYRRDESWETEIFPYDNYTPKQFDALQNEMRCITEVPAQMQVISNKALLKELNPWLTEFGKLGERGLRALDLIKVYESGDPTAFWTEYVKNIMTPTDIQAYNAHKSGTMKLQPFYENTMDDMLYDFYKNNIGTMPRIYKPISSFKNISSPQSKLMLDGDSTTYYHSGDSQKADSWIGLDLGEPVDVEKIVILQGRNSVNDNDLFGKAVLETSIDGKDWQSLGDEYIRQYKINWQGSPVRARYVRLRCLDRSLRSWVGIRLFQVNPVNEKTVGVKISADGNSEALLAFDNNPNTTFTVDNQFGFGRKAGASTAILLLDTLAQPVSLQQYDSKNTLIRADRIDTPFARIELDEATDRMVFEGPARIFEIIQK